MIEAQYFTSQAELLKWLHKGRVKWTKKQLSNNLKHKSFSTYWNNQHVYICRLAIRKYFVGNRY